MNRRSPPLKIRHCTPNIAKQPHVSCQSCVCTCGIHEPQSRASGPHTSVPLCSPSPLRRQLESHTNERFARIMPSLRFTSKQLRLSTVAQHPGLISGPSTN